MPTPLDEKHIDDRTNRCRRSTLTAGGAVLSAAVVIALAGTTGAVAGSLITGKQIKNGSITGADLKDKTIKTKDLSPTTVKTLSGTAGPAGPQGVAGVPGAVGPAGPRGLDGLNGLNEVRGAFAVPATVVTSQTMSLMCDADERAIGGGGGGFSTISGSPVPVISESFAVDGDKRPILDGALPLGGGWRVTLANAGDGGSFTGRAFVYCAKD